MSPNWINSFSLKRLALLLFVVVPVAAWVLVKPVRVLAPALVGISCSQAPVCVEEPPQLKNANELYAAGTAFVSQSISPLAGSPRVIFCSSEACANAFGLGARAAVTLGTFGTIIGPRGWTPYYVRHELIHHLQCQRLGVLRRLWMPSWFVEGMAYSLSQDPRSPLAEPWESDRSHFNSWYANIAKDQLWQEANRL
jgi:hypothetical protein